MSVYFDYPVGRCDDEECTYGEPHRHGLDCDKACKCAGVGAVTQPTDEYSVPTCDWGFCNRETVAERLEVDIATGEECWLSVCSWHAGWDDQESADPVRCPKCGAPHSFHDPACVVHPDLIQDHNEQEQR